MSTKLHPSIKEFKAFVGDRPDIISQVRSGHKSWQSIYEDWLILGENGFVDEETRREKTTTEKEATKDEQVENKSDLWNQTLDYLKKLDVDQVQNQITQLGSILATVQGIIGQFQSDKNKNKDKEDETKQKPSNFFSFNKD